MLNTAFFATYTAMRSALGQIFGARRTYVLVGVLSLAATLAMPLLSMAVTGTALFASLLIAQLVLGVALAPVFPVFACRLRDRHRIRSRGGCGVAPGQLRADRAAITSLSRTRLPSINGYCSGGTLGPATRGREGAASRARPRSPELH